VFLGRLLPTTNRSYDLTWTRLVGKLRATLD
jgi:hypothetical protein